MNLDQLFEEAERGVYLCDGYIHYHPLFKQKWNGAGLKNKFNLLLTCVEDNILTSSTTVEYIDWPQVRKDFEEARK